MDYSCHYLELLRTLREHSALNALHTADVLHRGLNPRCIGLVPGKHAGEPKTVKVFQAGFHVALLDMNRSERFLPSCPGKPEHQNIPEGWYVDYGRYSEFY